MVWVEDDDVGLRHVAIAVAAVGIGMVDIVCQPQEGGGTIELEVANGHAHAHASYLLAVPVARHSVEKAAGRRLGYGVKTGRTEVADLFGEPGFETRA